MNNPIKDWDQLLANKQDCQATPINNYRGTIPWLAKVRMDCIRVSNPIGDLDQIKFGDRSL